EPHLQAALAAAPRDRRLLEALGTIGARTDRPALAESRFRAALEIDPRSIGARLGLAAVFTDTGRYDAALAEIAEVRRLAPDHPATLMQEARLLIRRGRSAEGEAAARRALQGQAGSAEAHYLIGLALEQRGALREASEAMERARAIAPDHLGALSHLATLAARLGLPREAERFRLAHRAALAKLRVEERVRGPRLQAVEAFNKEDYATALRELLTIAREDPSDPQVHLHLGSTYLALGRHDEALRSLQESLRLDPHGDRALTELGRWYAVGGRLPEARQALERAIAANPEFPEPHYLLAGVLRAQGDLEGFGREMRRFEELRARSPDSAMEIVIGGGDRR
ncbi:MAG: tetratricopeptide repeat protein, partial [Candidatus Polarisedimenticolia bacterium]